MITLYCRFLLSLEPVMKKAPDWLKKYYTDEVNMMTRFIEKHSNY